MKALYKAGTIQIEVTNACTHLCANCTRCVGHHKKPFMMSLDVVERAIQSLEGYPGTVGIMGGEPTLHPQFEEICSLVQKYVPPHRAG
ncbi:MAG: radical SAM protein, partial [bacterium]